MNANKLRLFVTVVFALALSCLALTYVFTVSALAWARSEGVYPTPQEGTIARANRYYCGVEKVNIEHASANSFDGSKAHVWYVIYRVYADHHAPCDPQNPGSPLANNRDFESAGNFYLNVKDGWVFMPEGPAQILAFTMKAFGLAGPGDPYHIPREVWGTGN